MRLNVQCLECGRRFKTASMLPECPKCGGSDIEPAYTQPESKQPRCIYCGHVYTGPYCAECKLLRELEKHPTAHALETTPNAGPA